jgi:hypothetical protein
MTCMALAPRGPGAGARPAAGSAPPAGSYGPAALRTAYGLASAAGALGAGTTVAIVDAYDDPRAGRDLAAYRARFGLTACQASGADPCLRIVNASGGSRRPGRDKTGEWEFEESIDLDMISAACPNCRILLVEAKSDSISDLAAAESYASGHASVVSNSWGSGAEFTGQIAFDRYFRRPGVAIVAAAGDSGYGPQYPASAQFVTAVGGTTLAGASAVSRGTQTAWSGTGSGCSALEARPAWQAAAVPGGCQNRTEADVSAVADPATPVAVYDSVALTGARSPAGWTAAGGTSVATPIIAASYALAGRPAPGSYPAAYPYLHPGSFTDVTAGPNGSCEAGRGYLCQARRGYDGPTGLGTPDGVAGFAGPAAAVTVADPGSWDLARGRAARLRISAVATGAPRLSYAARGLPPGLRIAAASGLISGQPSRTGSYPVTVTASGQGAGSGSVTFQVVVIAPIVSPDPVYGLVRLGGGPGCLAASGRGLARARIQVSRCTGARTQAWRYAPGRDPGGAGTLRLRGRCLTLAGPGAGASASLRACRGKASQRWQLATLGWLSNPGSGKCLAGPGKSSKYGTRVVLARCGTGTDQSWQLPAAPVLSGVAGRCLTDPGYSRVAGTRATLPGCRAAAAQKWARHRDGTLRIRGLCLAVAGGSRKDGAAVRLARCSNAASQDWSPGPGGQLVNDGSGRCLAAATAGGARLAQQDCYGRPGEIWAIS